VGLVKAVVWSGGLALGESVLFEAQKYRIARIGLRISL
jgi:hypothetical protein